MAEELLYWGKVPHLARCPAPEVPPHDLLDWTREEWGWAVANERAVWSELRNEETLYTRRRMDIRLDGRRALHQSRGRSPGRPDRLGWVIGMRWVEDLMARRTDLEWPGLMAQEDVLPFLQAYRPGS